MTALEAIESLAGVCDSVFVNESTHRHVNGFTGEAKIVHQWAVTTFDGETLTSRQSGQDLQVLVSAAKAEHLKKTGKLCGEWDPVLLGA